MAVASGSSQTFLPAYQENYLKDLLANAAALGTEGGVQVPEYQVAGMTPLQKQAIQMGASGLGAYAPFFQSAANQMGTGAQTLGTSLGTLGTGLGTMGTGLGTIDTGLETVGQSAEALGTGLGTVGQGAQTLAGSIGAFDPASISQFMNPYTEQVIEQSQKDIARLGGKQQQALKDRAVAAGAFGGGREAIGSAEIGRNVLDQQARTGAGLRAQGFQQAMGQAQTAFENQQRRQQQASQIFGGLGTAQAGIGGQQAALGQTQAGIGQAQAGIGGQQAGIGQAQAGVAGQQAGIGGQQAALGQGMAQLGLGLQGAQQKDVSGLLGLGGLEQAQQQAGLDAYRKTISERARSPYQNLGFLSDIFRGVPSTGGTYTQKQTQDPSMLSQVAGLGLGLASLGQAYPNMFSGIFGQPA